MSNRRFQIKILLNCAVFFRAIDDLLQYGALKQLDNYGIPVDLSFYDPGEMPLKATNGQARCSKTKTFYC